MIILVNSTTRNFRPESNYMDIAYDIHTVLFRSKISIWLI